MNDISSDTQEQECWRRIGIWGNESNRCEKLKFVKHCRHCDVFEQAARVATMERQGQISDLSLSTDKLIEKERHAGNKSLMPFRIGGQCIAVPSKSVLTISDQVAIHSIPYNKNPLIKGLVAINHEVYTFIDLGKLLEIEINPLNLRQEKLHSLFIRTIVVDFAGRIVVFYVDEVYQIHRYFNENVLVDNQKLVSPLINGVIDNKGIWCSDCHLLNMTLVSAQLAASVK